MVDAIGTTVAKLSERRVAPVARAAAASATMQAAENGTTPVATAARRLAAEPPVDAERVALIKQAVANGTFPISPATIADRLIALRYDWMADDQA